MEIGSEFYINSTISGENHYLELINYPKRYMLSGRTGLSLVAEELKKALVHNILLPSYCCSSMILPFITEGLKVSFYNVLDLQSVELDDTVTAVLIMDYFGFVSADTLRFAQRCKAMGKVIVVDATQTAFSFLHVYKLADYIVVSYRKWFDSLCAVVYSKYGFTTQETENEHQIYVEIWRKAAFLKEKYIRFAEGEKQWFLTLYATANQLLETDYKGFRASNSEIALMTHIDSTVLRDKRRKNARILIDEVKKVSEIYKVQLIYSDIKAEDCPLFVPVLVDVDKRDFIRAEMSKKNIYCPCHWPIDHKYQIEETPYHRKELSLICDQRYGVEDMHMQVTALTCALSTFKKENV